MSFCAKRTACAGAVRENVCPGKKGGKIVSYARGHLKPIEGGTGCSHIMIEHQWCYFCRMAHARGGNTRPVAPTKGLHNPIGGKSLKGAWGICISTPQFESF